MLISLNMFNQKERCAVDDVKISVIHFFTVLVVDFIEMKFIGVYIGDTCLLSMVKAEFNPPALLQYDILIFFSLNLFGGL